MRIVIRLTMALMLIPALAHAEVAVPKDLDDWQRWAMEGQEFRRCPLFVNSDPNNEQERVCAWPSRLNLDLTASGGRFSQSWEVFKDSWVALPGNAEHWPRTVTVNGKPGAVVAREGVPQLRLSAGTYAIAGGFAWETRPESLAIPSQSGLVALMLDGRAISQADRPDGAVWLGKRRGVNQVQGLEVQVYRLLNDALPAILTTRLHLQVAGDAREELLSTVLPADFTPMSLDSALPARIDADGRLRVQARAGSWQIVVTARHNGAPKITLPAVKGLWPKQEIWSYAADDRLRVAAVEGAEGIDPAQANVPEDWRQFPSYRLLPGSSLQIVERSRGLSVQDGNRLTLRRQLYLDFNHNGFTLADEIGGQLRTDWRLDMNTPYRLASATKNGENLLVTEGANPGSSGVELRSPAFSLSTLARLDVSNGKLPATGWAERFDQVSGVLNLPPGHRLLAVLGADSAPGAWIEQWGLLDLFLLLICAAIALRLFGIGFAVTTLLAVALVHQENSFIVWLLLAVLIALVTLRVAPEGWPRKTVSWVRSGFLTLLLLTLVPFAITQIRFALYPQLADAGGIMRPSAAPPPGLEEVVVTGARATRAPTVEMATIGKLAAPEMAPAANDEIALDSVAPSNSAASSGVVDNPYGLNVLQKMQRYAPGTLVQTGPGRPQWNFVAYEYSWNGPVEANESVRFLILGKGWVALWRVLGVGLLAWIFFVVARSSEDLRTQWRKVMSLRAAAAASAVMLLSMSGVMDPVHASSTPDRELLNDLRTRLTRPPDCLPTCVEILAARLVLAPASLEANLDVSALTTVAVALPAAVNRFEPESVSVDGKAVAGVYRDPTKQYWITVTPGVHQVRIAGRLPPAESIQIVFPQVPHSIAIDGNGWDVTGVNDGRLLANTLELVRRKATAGGEASEPAAQFAPFVRVHRQVQLDLDWSVTTTIERLAPAKGGFSLQVPLLPGESVITAGVDARNGKSVWVGFDSTATQFTWQSGLARSDSLTFTAPPGSSWVEVWSFNLSPMWRATFSGTPAVMPQNVDPTNWSFEYHPRPGESLTVAVSRPVAVKGDSLAIDNAELAVTVGKRATESALTLSYRSTQGGRHSIKLPAEARVSEVSVDGVAVPVRPENGELSLAVLPGSHRVHVNWQRDTGVSLRTEAPAVDLRTPSSNINTTLRLPADRWILYAGGGGVGPAILYWGELLVFVAAAVLLSRSGRSPLKMHEWLLLGLGLSTFSWVVLLMFAAWQFAMRWRERLDLTPLSRRRFNAMQLILIALSVIAILSLVSAIPNGLLATPDMRIAGVGQSAGQLAWFNDQATGPLPTPWVLSVSLWWYKIAMLLWALWLAFALVRWLPQAWRGQTAGGLWRPRKTAVPS